MHYAIREYVPADEASWLRCRVLSFLGTAYYDDVARFAESSHYLHVYANYYTAREEPDRAVSAARPGLRPMTAFLHGELADEDELRREFSRVHVCRRFARPTAPAAMATIICEL
jgi:hypothetical protein